MFLFSAQDRICQNLRAVSIECQPQILVFLSHILSVAEDIKGESCALMQCLRSEHYITFLIFLFNELWHDEVTFQERVRREINLYCVCACYNCFWFQFQVANKLILNWYCTMKILLRETNISKQRMYCYILKLTKSYYFSASSI